MTILLHELVGQDDRRFSPYCWRTRMALAHKGLEYETSPVSFSDISGLCGGAHKTVPIIEDGDTIVCDSFDIALYLERTYPDKPSLFGGPGGQASCRFVESWTNAALVPIIARSCIKDIHDVVADKDKAYFRESREKRLGGRMEDLQAQREQRIEDLHIALMPLHVMLGKQPWIGGDAPLYHDHVVFGTLQWARLTSTVPLIKEENRTSEWFARMLELYDGLGASFPAAAA